MPDDRPIFELSVATESTIGVRADNAEQALAYVKYLGAECHEFDGFSETSAVYLANRVHEHLAERPVATAPEGWKNP